MPRQTNRRTRRAPLLAAALTTVIVTVVGCGHRYQADEDNPFYRQGVAQRKNGRYSAAAEAFEQCVRHTPELAGAHLQLAMLYEDHLDNLPRAIVHYQLYLDLSSDPRQAELVASWLERAERKLYRQLHATYGAGESLRRQPPPTPAAGPGLPAPPAVGPGPPATPAPEVVQAAADIAAPPAAARASATPAVKPHKARFYTVTRGDSLALIARKEFGRESEWKRIYDMNRDALPAPDRLQVGQRLRLPAAP